MHMKKDKDNEAGTLLAEIQAIVRCPYLSDLHSTDTLFDKKTKQLISEIPNNRYSLAAWSEAVNYIIGKSYTYSTVSDAKQTILEQ